MIQFELVTLSGTKFGQEVYEVLLPTPDGQIAVFENHSALVSTVVPGVIMVRRVHDEPDDMMEVFASSGGVVEIGDNIVRVLVDEADNDDDINEQEAQAAFERAQKLRAEAKDTVSLEKAQAMLDRQAVRLKVAGLRRHRKAKRS